MRLEPVGLDRHYNRYWMLPAAAAAADPAYVSAAAPPLLVIERHSLDSIRPAGLEAAEAALAAGSGSSGAGAAGATAGRQLEVGWQVGLYTSILQLQQLAQWLDPKGSRERPLSGEVTRLLDQHQQFAMQHAQPARPASADPAHPPPTPAELRGAALQRLCSAMLSFEEGNQAGTYDDLAGSEKRRQQWRQMVGAASTPQVGGWLAGWVQAAVCCSASRAWLRTWAPIPACPRGPHSLTVCARLPLPLPQSLMAALDRKSVV